MLMISYTEYRSLYDLDTTQTVTETWEEMVRKFSTHLRLQKKDLAPGFGPYVLKPTEPCTRHKDRKPRTWPHRCDDSVQEITLAVFDVDVGTQDDIVECALRLNVHNITHLWYTSYSYNPNSERPAFRLVIPLSEPVSPDRWTAVRAGIASKFSVPCDLKQCGGLSHFYYQPSCPPDADPIVDSLPGRFLDPADVPHVAVPATRTRLPSLNEWVPPEDPPPGTPIDLAQDLERLEARYRSLSHGKSKDKALILRRLLDGKELAEHGKRNDTTTIAAGVLASTLPGRPLAVLKALIWPSYQAMVEAGSSLSENELDRMLLTAMRFKAEYDAREEQNRSVLREGLGLIRSSIPTLT